MSVHVVAETGFGSGTNELYDRARPSYQLFALSHVRDAVKLEPPLNVVEIGAGTGIFTRALLAHQEWSSSIKEIRAVEPSSGMREVFSKQLASNKSITISDGTFDSTNIESGWADVLIIAQAFHWCPNYDAASAEFARILKPSGLLVLIWNLEDRDGAEWVAQLRDRIEQHEAGTPQFRLNLWRQTFETKSFQQFFSPPDETIWSYALPGTTDIAVNRACSKSYIAVLPEDEKMKVTQDVANIVKRGDGMVWMDQKEGIFEYPYKTTAVLAYKK